MNKQTGVHMSDSPQDCPHAGAAAEIGRAADAGGAV